jgi:uncharacterized protein
VLQYNKQRKRNRAILVSFFLFSVLLFSGCVQTVYSDRVEIHDQVILVEVVDTPEERQLGLMHREELCEHCGMLFVFEEEDEHSFWMKNTLIPLDIIFIDKDFFIVDIIRADPCEEDPCEFYTPSDIVLYAVEVNQGFSEEYGVVVGDEATFHLRDYQEDFVLS